MVPRLLKLIEEALAEARSEYTNIRNAPRFNPGNDLETRTEHARICVERLEDSLLRARLMFDIGESV